MSVFPVKGPPAIAVHPGELMREILDEHVRLPIAEAARRMGVARQSLYAALNGDGAVTADMALRFGCRLVGGGARTLCADAGGVRSRPSSQAIERGAQGNRSCDAGLGSRFAQNAG